MSSEKLAKIFKSNTLNQANFGSFNFSLYKIFLNLITKINRHDSNGKMIPVSQINRTYSLSASDYAKEFNISKDFSYKLLKTSASSLMKKSIFIQSEEEDVIDEINVCSKASYAEKKGQITIRFTDDIMPHLAELNERFTLYNLSEIIGFKSLYTTKFYELIMQYKTTGELNISVKNLRFALGCKNNYILYADFKRSVFAHAVKEINANYEINIKFKEIKDGRSVDRLEFSFKKAIADQVYDPVTKKIRNQLTRPKRINQKTKKIDEKASEKKVISDDNPKKLSDILSDMSNQKNKKELFHQFAKEFKKNTQKNTQ